ADALHSPGRHVQHVPSVSQWIRSFEQNHLEMVVVKRRPAGDLQIAAVVPDAADQRKAALVNLALNADVQLFHALEKAGESRRPIGQFPSSVLEAGADFVNDGGIQARARHEEKVTRTEATGDPA